MVSYLNSDSERLLQDLLADAEKHGLVLFVGAGINATFLSQWGDLLTSLLKKALQETAFRDARAEGLNEELLNWCKDQFDVCAQASIVKHILGPEQFRLEIQDALYLEQPNAEQRVEDYCRSRQAEQQKVDPSLEFLWRVAELCSKPQVKAVATFNFDTLLEHAIRGCGERNPRTYFGQVATVGDQKSTVQDIPVFHIHGLLPSAETLLRAEESIVFSYDDYFDKNSDPFSWETSTSLHLLRNFCTLWLGTSLKDWNMLRLLDAARSGPRESHSYCLQCLQEAGTCHLPTRTRTEKKKRFKEVAMRLQATMFDAVGMRLLIAGEDFNSVHMTLAERITSALVGSGGKRANRISNLTEIRTTNDE